MENFSHIFTIRIKHDFIFDYDDFVNKKDIYVYSEDEEGGEKKGVDDDEDDDKEEEELLSEGREVGFITW